MRTQLRLRQCGRTQTPLAFQKDSSTNIIVRADYCLHPISRASNYVHHSLPGPGSINMRLIKFDTMTLEYYTTSEAAPSYAILSHRWEADELVYDAWNPVLQARICRILQGRQGSSDEAEYGASITAGLSKVVGFCKKAMSLGCEYGWIDSLCIDKEACKYLIGNGLSG